MAHQGRMLVDQAYLQEYLVDFGNEKMEANWERTARLHQLFKEQMLSPQVSCCIQACWCCFGPYGCAKLINERPHPGLSFAVVPVVRLLPCSVGKGFVATVLRCRHFAPQHVQEDTLLA